MNWASDHDASLEALRRVQGSLSVELIMVPRRDFHFCRATDLASSIKAKNPNFYSFLPVLDDGGRIIGLYDAQRWFRTDAPDEPIGDDFKKFSEDMVIGANANIFDFLKRAEDHPTILVVSGNEVAGLVSISDLQQLPVRAALFALITSLEMALTLRIRREWGSASEGWLQLLESKTQKAIRSAAKKARRDDVYVDEIILTNFSDKSRVAVQSGMLSHSENWEDHLEAIRMLRNDLAHSKPFAASPDEAVQVCRTVNNILAIKSILLKEL